MASVTQQALLAQGANAVAARPGWHWPLSIVPDIPIWRDHSLFSDNAWLAALPFAASIVPKSVSWQSPLSAPDYLKSRPLRRSTSDPSSYAGNWLSSAGIVPAATPAFIGWQQELSVSRVTKQPLLAESVNGAPWLQAATIVSPAVAFLSRTSGLDTTHINAYTALINGLVADGVWTKLDMLHIYATQDSTTALLNLVSSNYNGTANGLPSFSVDLGFTGSNASGTIYIETGFNPSTAIAPNFVQNSAHISGWNLTNGTSSFPFMGSSLQPSGLNTDLYPKFVDGNAYFLCNDDVGGISVANATATGHYIANRSASNAAQGYRNGASVVTGSPTSAAVGNQTITTLSQHKDGSQLGAALQMAMASIGSSLSAGDVTLFYTRLRTYMTAVGVP